MQKTTGRFSNYRKWAFAGALLAVCLVPVFVKLIYYPHNIGSDDSYIHLQVARNIASGRGWGVNPGTSVNVSTSPLFTLLVVSLDELAPSHAVVLAQAASALAAFFGLILVYLKIYAVTGANKISLAAAASLAFSCNLWRWNGDVMEATLGFFWVALILYLFTGWRFSSLGCLLRGIVLGLAVLTRPELILALGLCLLLTAVLGTGRLRSILLIISGVAIPLVPWIIFCKRSFDTVLPTTFYAKATSRLMLWNPVITRQFFLLIAEAFFWPAILIAAALILLRCKCPARTLQQLVLPGFLLVGIIAFYYLRTPGLESIGRYLLPFFPCAGILLGLLLHAASAKIRSNRFAWLVGAGIGLHLIMSLAINRVFIAPTLDAFQSDYKATMEAAAEYLAAYSSPTTRVLINSDIGVVSYTANGRFFIADAGGLASPELRRRSLARQIEISKPKFVLQSFAASPGELATAFHGILRPVWNRRFRQHGLEASLRNLVLYTNIYRVEKN